MEKNTKDSITYFTKNPTALFLIDAIGAMLTAFLLVIIFSYFNQYVRMPKIMVTYLSTIAGCFFIYSATCAYFLKGNWIPFILVISTGNLLYCILILVLLNVYHPILTVIGIAYFLTEIIVISVLVYIEFNVVKQINKNVNKNH